MMGTFGGALEARQIDASDGKLVAEVTGEVEQEDGVLVIRRIHVLMRLAAPEEMHFASLASCFDAIGLVRRMQTAKFQEVSVFSTAQSADTK